MKKNLLILSYAIFFTQLVYCDTAEQIAKIAEVLHTVEHTKITEPQAKVIDPKEKYLQLIKENVEQLSKPYSAPASNPHIKVTREKIELATSKILELSAKDISNINIEKLAQDVIQPCYAYIVKSSIYPSLFSKQQQLQLVSFEPANEQTELELYDILNRIFLVWHLTKLIFQIPNDYEIALQWPDAQLSINNWIQLTQDAAQKLWQSLDPAVQMAAAQQEELQKKSLQKTNELSKIAQQFKDLQPSPDQLEQAKKVFASLIKFLSTQKLTHEIFTKYDFSENLGLALTHLQLIQQKFENDEKLPEHALFLEIKTLQNDFLQQMNKIYSNYFKKELAGHLGNKFLVVKHKFASKANGAAVPEMLQDDAVALLTDLIALWEIYTNLFPALSEKLIPLQHFNMSRSAQNWITETGNAGFTSPAEFNPELQLSLTVCLPAEPEKINKLSIAAQKIKSGIVTTGSAIKEKAQLAGSAIKQKAQATGGWFSSAWNSFKNYITRHVEEEIDEL